MFSKRLSSSVDSNSSRYKSALTVILFSGLIAAVFLSGKNLRYQLQWQSYFLEDELIIEMHEFNQLQREMLRLNRFLTALATHSATGSTSPTDIDLETLRLHTDLVQSRVTIIQKHKTYQGSDNETEADISAVVQNWLIIKQQINRLQQTPENVELQQAIISQLEQIEITINRISLINNKDHWIEYESLVESQHKALSFLIFLILSFFFSAALFSFYAIRFAKTRQSLLEKMEKASITDELTQIANRRYFNQVMDREWNRALRNQTQIALMLCDIDYFKRYNDHYGHQAGDECLHAIAQILSQSTHRASDFIARYGGEEFVIILPSATVQSALRFSARIHKKVTQARLKHTDSEVSGYVTLSIGIAVGVPAPNMRAETALKFADEALYEAKENGRNQSSERVFNLTRLHQWPQKSANAQLRSLI